MVTIGYYFLQGISWIFHLIPLRIHYLFSDFLFLLIYHLIRYRRKTVESNLRNSFPEKSKKERDHIARNFYHHLCDTFIETLYLTHMSEKELNKRVTYTGLDEINAILNQQKGIIGVVAHYGNWEWMIGLARKINAKYYVIYKPLHNKAFDQFFKNSRARFGAVPLDKNKTFRTLISDNQNGIVTFSGFLGDQTPKKNDIQYWTKFLNQDTPIFLGAEKIARKTNMPVVIAHMKKLKRGYYQTEIKVLFENPKNTRPFEITETHTRFLEKKLIEEPAYWLWSHKRWKHQKEQ